MARVFISYSSKDVATATRVNVDLRQLGHYTWMDQDAICVGDDIPDRIANGLRECDFVVVLLSESAVKSGWVEREWKTRYWDEVNQGRVIVMPVLIGACEVPDLLKTKKYADCCGERYTTGFAELALALASSRPGIVVKTAAPAFSAVPKADSRVVDLLAKVQDHAERLAPCLVQALALAKELKKDELERFCLREIDGWQATSSSSGTSVDNEHRTIPAYWTITAEINPQFPGWAGDMRNAISAMENDRRNFSPIRLMVSQGMSQIEREIDPAGATKLMTIEGFASQFFPGLNPPPDLRMRVYARGDAMADVVSATRAKLSRHLLGLLPSVG